MYGGAATAGEVADLNGVEKIMRMWPVQFVAVLIAGILIGCDQNDLAAVGADLDVVVGGDGGGGGVGRDDDGVEDCYY